VFFSGTGLPGLSWIKNHQMDFAVVHLTLPDATQIKLVCFSSSGDVRYKIIYAAVNGPVCS